MRTPEAVSRVLRPAKLRYNLVIASDFPDARGAPQVSRCGEGWQGNRNLQFSTVVTDRRVIHASHGFCADTSHNAQTMGEVEAQQPPVRAAATALNDTLVLAFIEAYHGRPPLAPFDGRLHRCAHALARLAVVVMAECEA